MNSFIPDIVVEVTAACNRACTGCYAPNVVSNKRAEDLMKLNPELFLSVEKMKDLITFWELPAPSIVSVRGGEPSLHPNLPEILKDLKYLSRCVVLETHGRWLLSKDRSLYQNLIDSVSEEKVTVKVSFDSMHGLSPIDLKEITDVLSLNEIPFLIAITEDNEEGFFKTRSLCPWIENDKIIFQQKSKTSEGLLKPLMGVINVKGELQSELLSKFQNNFSILEAAI